MVRKSTRLNKLNLDLEYYLGDKREGFLQRWHTENTIRKESLAEHQWFVTRNAMYICSWLKELEIAEPDVEMCMRMAMFHDEVEIYTGDVNGVAKREWPAIKVALSDAELNVLDKMFISMPDDTRSFLLDPMFRYQQFWNDDIESQIIKYCDVMEAHFFAKTEVKMGNQYMKIAVTRTEEWLKAMNYPWLESLRSATKLDIGDKGWYL